MDLILGLIIFLSLMFLVWISGDRQLLGALDGRWLAAPFDLLSYFWDMVCEATDRVWCFVFDHIWWVTATVTGAVGIVLVAIILVSGLSNEAQAVRQDERAVMNAGGVLDSIPVLNTRNVLQTSFETRPVAIAQMIRQVPTPGNRFWTPPVIEQPVISNLPVRPPIPSNSRPSVIDEVKPWNYREPISPVGRLSVAMEPFVERIGRRIRSQRIDELIQQTVMTLRGDQWRTFSDTLSMSRDTSLAPALREDSELALDDLYSRVRVVPGDFVSSNNLKVEKSAPSANSSGSFEIQIRLTNLGRDRISGIVVRELLPPMGSVQSMAPRGVYRDGIVTWLLNDFEPMQEEILTLQVATTNAMDFVSYTEVSATSAVASRSRVTPRDRPLPPVEQPIERTFEKPLPKVAPRPELRLPDVRLTLESTPPGAQVGESVDVFFRVENVGKAPAEGVRLRVDLPFGLDHRLLKEDDIDRRVGSSVRRLEAGESRQMKLTVQPTSRGRHFATAELQLQETQLDIQSFEIVATEKPTEVRPRLSPQPDFP